MSSQDSVRSFVGIALPEPSREELTKSLGAAFAGVSLPGRSVSPRNWHITLQFLGNTTAAVRGQLLERLRLQKLVPPFNLVTGLLGAFPEEKTARVVWLRIRSGARNLGSIREALTWITEGLGLPVDPHPYTPHLTLARSPTPHDIRPLLEGPTPKGVVIPVTSISLFSSVSTAAGSEYGVLDRVDLPI